LCIGENHGTVLEFIVFNIDIGSSKDYFNVNVMYHIEAASQIRQLIVYLTR